MDALQRRTRFTYDSAGRTKSIVRPAGQSIALSYDGAGRLSSITPPGRPQHQFAYTAGGLLETYTPPAVSGVADPATRYFYDATQRLTKVKRPTGDSLLFGYDANGRATTLRYGASDTIRAVYNALTGKADSLKSTTGQHLALTYSGMLLRTIVQSGQLVGNVTYDYDTRFRLGSTRTGPDGADLVVFTYDNDDLLIGAKDLTISRGATTRLVDSTTLGSGSSAVKTALTYDSLGSLVSETATRGATALYTYTLGRDSLDRITSKTEIIQGDTITWAFAYDSAGRLQQVTRDGSVAAVYGYDANGNRLSRTVPGQGVESGTFDDQDRVLTYNGASYLHNAGGQLTHKIVGTDTTRYTYDALGSLRRVRLPSGDSVDYVIDPLGRRVGRKVNGVFTNRWVYESDLRIASEHDNVNTTTRYVYGTRTNVPEYMIRGGQQYRFITDHLGSVRLVVRVGDGTIAQRIDYDEFGRVTFNSSAGFQPFGYAGGLYDSLSGLARFGARDYDAQSGQWAAPDPIGFAAQELSLYSYAHVDPINVVDPDGEQPEWLRRTLGVCALVQAMCTQIYPELPRVPTPPTVGPRVPASDPTSGVRDMFRNMEIRDLLEAESQRREMAERAARHMRPIPTGPKPNVKPFRFLSRAGGPLLLLLTPTPLSKSGSELPLRWPRCELP